MGEALRGCGRGEEEGASPVWAGLKTGRGYRASCREEGAAAERRARRPSMTPGLVLVELHGRLQIIQHVFIDNRQE